MPLCLTFAAPLTTLQRMPVPSDRVNTFQLLAPAKINLHLRVGSLSADQFHPLLTWMCTVALFDKLTFSYASNGDLRTENFLADPISSVPIDRLIDLTCTDPTLPCDESNLICRCGRVLALDILSQAQRSISVPREAESVAGNIALSVGNGAEKPVEKHRDESERGRLGLRAVRILLEKKIPTGAGLGGGSSDGATALLGLNRVWAASPKQASEAHHLAKLSSQCGSDLPFFFYGESSICTGRGQYVNPSPRPKPRWCLLLLPKISMPTPAVYRKFDEMRLGMDRSLTQPPDFIAPDFVSWSKLPALELLPLLANDLEAPSFAIKPELGQLRMDLEQSIGRIVRMSGSGSSLFTLFDEQDECENVATKINSQFNVQAVAVELAPKNG